MAKIINSVSKINIKTFPKISIFYFLQYKYNIQYHTWFNLKTRVPVDTNTILNIYRLSIAIIFKH